MNMRTADPATTEEEPEDLRAAIEAAVEEHDEPETPPETPPTTHETPAASETPPETPPATPETPAPVAETPTVAPVAPVVDTSPVAKAPGTWTPGAREKWVTLPAEVKEEVWKREREASRALTMSADARKLQHEFEKTMQPYLGFIAAENSNPLQAVNNMMQTAAALRVGTPAQKVQVVAHVIKQFGIDLRALDSVLAGQQPQFDPQTMIDQRVQEALRPILQERQQAQQSQAALFDQQVDQELNTFVNDPKHEFYPDVKDLMADLIEVAARQGREMGLTDAYERAILMHEPVRRVVEARRQAEAARTSTAKAHRARGAAISVTPSQDIRSAPQDPGDSVRSAIEAAMSKTEGR